ncbi:MAG: hypothetical protein IT289_01915 [Oligoflexia bacterium]|nr:hypothetical protein [Oligoflexia bacterium]
MTKLILFMSVFAIALLVPFRGQAAVPIEMIQVFSCTAQTNKTEFNIIVLRHVSRGFFRIWQVEKSESGAEQNAIFEGRLVPQESVHELAKFHDYLIQKSEADPASVKNIQTFEFQPPGELTPSLLMFFQNDLGEGLGAVLVSGRHGVLNCRL